MSTTSRPMKPVYKNLALWALIIVIGLLVFQFLSVGDEQRDMVSYSDFIKAVEQGRVTEVEIQGERLVGFYTDRTAFATISPDDPELVKTLRNAEVTIKVEAAETTPIYVTYLFNLIPWLLLIGIWFFIMRRMQGDGKTMTFGKSKAKLLNKDESDVSFANVAGIDEAKEEVGEIVDFLKNPKKFTKLGGRIPKGVLLMGSPGTGKTLLAKAIAGEAGVPFFTISGSDFVEMFVGVGASRVRDLFIQGKKHAPCIIFIDEIDAVGRHRGAGLGGGHDEREQTLNQLLVEMDGFESSDGVILIAATNRPDVLDPALLRPGRFDRQVVIPRPDINGRAGILKVHAKEVPLNKDVKLKVLARGTPGFSGADLENMVNEAALNAAREGKSTVGMEDFEKAKDKVLMGAERRSLVLTEEERNNSAYHEAGHALVGLKVKHADPIHKVSIIPRGRALGVTQYLPIDERHNYSRDYLLDQLVVLQGGRAAEWIALGQITTGATNDIERATEMARKMVCKWGMSDKLGPLTYGREEEHVFLGKEIAAPKDYSEKTAEAIDEEVRSMVRNGLKRAEEAITANREALENLAKALLERETLSSEEVDKVVAGETLPEIPDKDNGNGNGGGDEEVEVEAGSDEAGSDEAGETVVQGAPDQAPDQTVDQTVDQAAEEDPRQEKFDF